ncbi:testis-expressed protein 47 [Indicator indicator]|uniref:testis-expressed protein 47 n=1 Tax=Indicator indicator TaxID=1002788 RepID=UPI0023DF6226|nr:testis-expressed protein 47 [Indicator indicator]
MSEQALGPSRPRTPEPAAPERQTLLAVRQRQLRPNRFPLHRLLVVARLGEAVSVAAVAGGWLVRRGQAEHRRSGRGQESVWSGNCRGHGFPTLGHPEPTFCPHLLCFSGLEEHRTEHPMLAGWLHHNKLVDKLPVFLLKQGYYRELFENILEDHSGEDISGLLLLYPSCIFHLVESCSSTIHLIIQDLASLQNQGHRIEFPLFPHSALLQDIKVLVVAHNIPTRLCPDWYMATATAAVTWPQGSPPAESTAEVVAECLALLPQVAACIQSFEDDSEDMDESLHTLGPELLISPETVDYLCHAEECSTPEDFLRIYLSPSQVVLDSETVWPVPSHLFA